MSTVEGIRIRWMIRRDMPEVLEIEKQSFEFPWGEDDFLRCLRQRNVIGKAVVLDEQVIGYYVYALSKTYADILSMAVHPEFRRRGVGSSMVQSLKATLSHKRRTRIITEVRETNMPAQLFFRARGFRAIQICRNYYDDTDEDCYRFSYRVPVVKAAIDRARS